MKHAICLALVLSFGCTDTDTDADHGSIDPADVPDIEPVIDPRPVGVTACRIQSDHGMDGDIEVDTHNDYDAMGRLIRAREVHDTWEAQVDYAYDRLGRLVWTVSDPNFDGMADESQYEYDSQGRLVAETHDWWPGGYGSGAPMEVTHTYSADSGRLARSEYDFRADGQITETVLWEWNRHRLLVSKTTTGPSIKTFYSRSDYTYDLNGRLASEVLRTTADSVWTATDYHRDGADRIERIDHDSFGDGDIDSYELFSYGRCEDFEQRYNVVDTGPEMFAEVIRGKGPHGVTYETLDRIDPELPDQVIEFSYECQHATASSNSQRILHANAERQ